MLHGTSAPTVRWPFDSICRSINSCKKSLPHICIFPTTAREIEKFRRCFVRSFYCFFFYFLFSFFLPLSLYFIGFTWQPFSHFSISRHSACLALKLFHLLFNLLYPLARGKHFCWDVRVYVWVLCMHQQLPFPLPLMLGSLCTQSVFGGQRKSTFVTFFMNTFVRTNNP